MSIKAIKQTIKIMFIHNFYSPRLAATDKIKTTNKQTNQVIIKRSLVATALNN